MKNCFKKIAAVLLIGGTAVCCTPSKTPKQAADEKMQAIMNELKPVGLSVAVVKGDKIVYANAFGARTLDPYAALDTHSVFRIASISKTFTATGLMQLYEQGKFDLDDDISAAMGFNVRNPKYPDTKITYRMLLSHTSSINDSEGYYEENALDLLNPAKNPGYANAFNDYEPGTAFEYSNLGFNTLGALLERLSGERFDKYMEKNVTGKIGMNTGFMANHLPDDVFAALYTLDADSAWAVQFPVSRYKLNDSLLCDGYIPGYSTPRFSPTGGVKTNPSDLAKFMKIHMGNGESDGVRLLKKETVEMMHTPVLPDSMGNGYGMNFLTSSRLIPTEIMIGHTGSAYGLYSAMFFNKEKTFGIIMMTNGYGGGERVNGFIRIQSDVINALYDIFIKGTESDS